MWDIKGANHMLFSILLELLQGSHYRLRGGPALHQTWAFDPSVPSSAWQVSNEWACHEALSNWGGS